MNAPRLAIIATAPFPAVEPVCVCGTAIREYVPAHMLYLSLTGMLGMHLRAPRRFWCEWEIIRGKVQVAGS